MSQKDDMEQWTGEFDSANELLEWMHAEASRCCGPTHGKNGAVARCCSVHGEEGARRRGAAIRAETT